MPPYDILISKEPRIPMNDNERLLEVLKPLQQENAPAEYLYQMKALVEWDRRLRALESLYTDILSRVEKLKNEMDSLKQ